MSSAPIDDLNEIIRRFTQLIQQKPLNNEAAAELDELEQRLLSYVADEDKGNRERYGRDALCTLLEAYRADFVRFVQRRPEESARTAAEDVVQEVLKGILRAYPKGGLKLAHGRRSLDAYVKMAATRFIARQQQANKDTLTDPDKVPADVEMDAGRPVTLDRVLGDTEMQQWIAQTIMAGLVRRVPQPRVRSRSMRSPSYHNPNRDAVLVFGQLHGLTVKELAEQLNLPIAQVPQYQRRARAKFKKMFAALCVARSMRIADGDRDGTAGCPELTEKLIGWDPQKLQAFSTEHFHEVLKHAKSCKLCKPTYKAVLDMTGEEVAGIFRGVPVLASPEALRRWLQDQDDDDRRSWLDVLLMRRSDKAVTEHPNAPAISGGAAAAPSSGHVAAAASGATAAGEPTFFSTVKNAVLQPFSPLTAKLRPWVSLNDPSSMVQLSESGPAIVGVTTAVVLGVTAVLAGPDLLGKPPAEGRIAAPPATLAPTTSPTNPRPFPLASTPTTTSPANTATAGRTTPTPGANTPGRGSGAGPTTGNGTIRDPDPGGVNPTAPPRPRPPTSSSDDQPAVGRVRINAAPLFYDKFQLQGPSGTPTGWLITSARQDLTLSAGGYGIQLASGRDPAVRFRVTDAGTIDYDTKYNNVLRGRGTRTLTLEGAEVTLNTRALADPRIYLADYQAGPIAKTRTIRLLPDQHRAIFGSSNVMPWTFDVTLQGRISYDSSNDSFLNGRGTTTLTFLGHPLRIDARDSGAAVVAIPDPQVASNTAVIEGNLLPFGKYRLVLASGVLTCYKATFALSRTGGITLTPMLAAHADLTTVNGTPTIHLTSKPPADGTPQC